MKYRDDKLNVLAGEFEVIEDIRDSRGKRHRLIDILILAVYGLLWGHTDFTNMAIALKYKEEFFTKLLGLPNGVPSHDTFSAVFSIIDQVVFLECFINWIWGIANACGQHVAIDGKAIRAACEKIHKGKVPYIVNAYLVDLGLCIGQIRIDAKTNEIKGIPEMLKWLDLEGAVVTIDAIGCQREIVKQLKEMNAHFVLPVKENQPALHEDIRLEMHTMIDEKKKEDKKIKESVEKGIKIETPVNDVMDVYNQYNEGHSRWEKRTYYVWNDNSCVNKEKWPCVESVGMVIRERLEIHKDENNEIIDEEPSVEVETYIMDQKMKALEFACYVRGHWGIENSLHWVLDDFFREDRCTARVKNATENLALLRKFVYNLMNLDENVAGMSRKHRSIYYQNEPGAVEKLLFETIPSKY